MYRITHKVGSVTKSEIHTQTRQDALDVLLRAADKGITENREFIFLPDVGASGASLRFHDGEVYVVTKEVRHG